jgi:hypothetical protein
MDDRSDNDERLLERSKRDFDAAVEATDAAAALRLRAARARALEHAGRAAWSVPPRLWVPVAAAAGLAAILLVPRIDSVGGNDGRELDTIAAVDLDLLLGEEEIEMFAELEFYEWLELEEGVPTDDEVQDGVG